MSLAQAIREVSCERDFAWVPQQSLAACPASACSPVVVSCCLPTIRTARAVTAGRSVTVKMQTVTY
jgi:hypothetical protein